MANLIRRIRHGRKGSNETLEPCLVVPEYNGPTFDDDFVVPEENAILGNGQFGLVKACSCRKTGILFCVKEIESSKVYNNSQQQTENELLMQVCHPNIVRLVQIYFDNKVMKIVMERAFGGDLLDRILNHPQGRLTERLTRFFIWQVLSSLQYLHSRNIAHRDLKPENVLLSGAQEFTQAQVCDFGYARMVGEESFMQSIVGTMAYWAPEVQLGHYTLKVDIWSIGVVCYVALSGNFPYENSLFEERFLLYQNMYPATMDCWRECSEISKDFISKCLLLDPDHRLNVEQAMCHKWLQNYQLKKDLETLEQVYGQPGLYNSHLIQNHSFSDRR